MRNFKRYTYTADELSEMARDNERQRQSEEAFEAKLEAMIAEVHPALRPTARYLLETSGECSEASCSSFVLEQVAKIGARAAESLKPEVRAIYRDIRARGGEAYADHKARLIELKEGL